jgi:prephenate dehydrogenase/chorismate mutase
MKIAIVGGSGKMGTLVGEILTRHGLTVFPVGRQTKNIKEIIKECGVIIFSIPSHALKDSIKNFKGVDLSDKLLVDLSSQVNENSKILPTFIHLLFGPDICVLKDQHVVVSEGVTDRRFADIVNIFKKEGAIVTTSSSARHDYMMAFVQALSQFNSIALAKTISESDTSKKELTDFSSVTFSLNAAAISRIILQKPELWANIQFRNKFFKKVLARHLKNIKTLADCVEKKDYKKFEKIFAKIVDFWKETDSEFSSSGEKAAAQKAISENELDEIRKKLDKIDSQLIELLALRQSHMKDIGHYKTARGIPYYQPDRELEILKMRIGQANRLGLNQDIIQKLFIAIFENSREIQAEHQEH